MEGAVAIRMDESRKMNMANRATYRPTTSVGRVFVTNSTNAAVGIVAQEHTRMHRGRDHFIWSPTL